ncbi:MAG: DUF1501 domain-containing protein [Planctomycetia bacterium]
MATYRTCDGRTRRDFLKVGVLGATGLTLADYLRMSDAGEAKAAGAKSCIFVHLGGGPSHMDTFDLKPKASAEFRGEFNPIATNAPGVEISEHLPKMAKCADKYVILRGVSHTLAAHDFGTKYLTTGNRPLPSLAFPGYGAVLTKERGSDPELPPFVAIPRTPEVAGYLGVEFAPFSTGSMPKAGQPYSVRGISLTGGNTIAQVEKRQKLLASVDNTFDGMDKSDLLNGLDRFSERAYSIVSSSKARDAFDVSKESTSIRQNFGSSDVAQSCLLATRLVEAGVRFVTVSSGGWDTHQNNFENLKTKLLPALDDALAGLFTTLAQKGLLESTAVIVTGEFGRTPKINKNVGRDHWPRAMFVVMGGGSIKGGRVLGASDDKGMGPAKDAITPDAVAASLYHNLGVDSTKEYKTATGRPVMIVREGQPIKELFS